MKLIRYEIGGLGIFQECGVIRENAPSSEYRSFVLNSYELHCPQQNEFLLANEPSKASKFYFTELGLINHKEMIEEIEHLYPTYDSRKFTREEIELSDIKKYTCYYQDKDQMCIEIIK